MIIYEPITYSNHSIIGDNATLKCGKIVYVTNVDPVNDATDDLYKDSETKELIMNHWAIYRHMPRLALHWKSLMVKYSPNSEYQYIDWAKTPHNIVT